MGKDRESDQNDEESQWEPLPDSRPSLPYVLFAVAVATAITLVVFVLLGRLTGN